jgi:hypothetical protein
MSIGIRYGRNFGRDYSRIRILFCGLCENFNMAKRKRIIPIESMIYIEPDGRVNIVNCPKEMVELVHALNPNNKKTILEFKPIKKKKANKPQ